MKLYEAPNNCKVVLDSGIELNFHSMDGMFSKCTDDDGNVYYIPADTEITVKLVQRNDVLDEVAREFDSMRIAFGDTADSFARYVRDMKLEK